MRYQTYLPALCLGILTCGGGAPPAASQDSSVQNSVQAASAAWYSSLVITAPTQTVVGTTGLKASITPLSGTTYTWSVTGGTIQGSNTGLTIAFTATQVGTLKVSCKATHGSQSSTGSVTVQVLGALPATPRITAPTSVPTGTANLSASVASEQGCSYAWTVSGGTPVAGANSPNLTFSAGPVGTLVLTCTATNANGKATAQAQVAVQGKAPAAPVITAPATVNAQTSGWSASANTPAGATTNWIISGQGTAASGATNPVFLFNAGSAGSINLTCTVANAYGSASSQATVQVQGIRPAAVQITAPVSVGEYATGITASVPSQSGCSYVWAVQGGTAVAGANTATLTCKAGATGTLSLTCTVTNAYGSTSAQKTIQILTSAPTTPVITAPSQVHPQSLANPASIAAQSGCSYAWTVEGGVLTAGQGTPAISFSAGGPGTLRLNCTVTNSAGVTASDQATVAVVAYQAQGYYGSGMNVDALANTPIGKSVDYQVSYRIRSNHTGALKAVRPFFIWSYTTAGYALGTGGTIKVQIQTDDGSANHNPSGVALASLTYAKPVNDAIGFYPLLAFASQPTLQAGTLYHVVFTNVDPDPVNNWVCLDSAYMDYAGSPMQPTIADQDLATLWRTGSSGTWSLRKSGPNESFTPILELNYADGASQGQGYMEFWIGNAKTISGSKGVRQIFTVAGSDRLVASAAVRIKYVSGSGPLTIRLEKADGTLIDQGTVASVPVTPGFGGSSWAKVTFATPRTLQVGQSYNLVLSAPADTVFTAFPMRKGSDKGYSSTTVFTEGYAQFNGGTGWTGWDQWSQPNRKDSDLQFYFEVVQ